MHNFIESCIKHHALSIHMSHHKLIIIGGGPSAWTAATYAARADIHPLVLAGEKAGGQLMLTTVVENFPGFPQGIDGPELMMNMRAQAERFGADVIEETATSINRNTSTPQHLDAFTITTLTQEFTADAIIIATGAETIWLDVPGEKELIGRGVSCCAVCDAAFFRNKQTVVVGGGDAAMEDTLALTKFASSVTVIHRRNQFRASKIMAERVLNHPKVSVRWNTTVEQIIGSSKVESIKVKDSQTDEMTEIATDGIFVAIGHQPATAWLKGIVDLDEKGFIKTNFSKILTPSAIYHLPSDIPTMTSIEGIFAAGDCVDFRYKQAATAGGFGIMAALDAQWWLESREIHSK